MIQLTKRLRSIQLATALCDQSLKGVGRLLQRYFLRMINDVAIFLLSLKWCLFCFFFAIFTLKKIRAVGNSKSEMSNWPGQALVMHFSFRAKPGFSVVISIPGRTCDMYFVAGLGLHFRPGAHLCSKYHPTISNMYVLLKDMFPLKATHVSINFGCIGPLSINTSNYSTHITLGAIVYCCRHVYVLTAHS